MPEEIDAEAVERLVSDRLSEILSTTSRLFREESDADHVPIHPESSMALDDIAANPFMLSHMLTASVQASLEHFDALARLIGGDHGVLHIRADYTLVRSAIEAAGLAYWLLMPGDRTERVTRALRASLKDATDGSLVASDDGKRQAVVQRRRERIESVAARSGIATSDAVRGVTMTELLREVGGHAGTDCLTSWRLCAGMAHSRQWALGTMSDAQEIDRDAESGVITHQLTARLDLLFVCASEAYWLLEKVRRIYRGRCSPPETAPTLPPFCL